MTDMKKLRAIWYRARINNANIESVEPDEFAELFTFTDKDSYLEWVEAWKVEYAEKSAMIRSKRIECKTLQKAGNPDASTMQSFLASYSKESRLLLALRRASKKYSWALKRAAGAAVSASL